MAEEQPAKIPTVQLLNNFIKDLSFENIAAQNQLSINDTPKFELNLNVGNRPSGEELYEVSLNLKIKATDGDQTIFILDLDHAGRFNLTNVDEKNLVPLLYIECPRILFPYTRRIVSDITVDGGMMPLNLENIDFVALFQNSIRQAQERQAEAESKNNGEKKADDSKSKAKPTKAKKKPAKTTAKKK